MKPRRARARPLGRQQVVDALLEAAADLFAEHGPRAVSAREIARRARVNHGLVHRHFGSKDALVHAVIVRLLEGWRQQEPGFVSLLAADRRTLTVLARALLDGYVNWLEHAEFPQVRGAIESLERACPALDARALTASSLALALGWYAFEPFVVAATELEACPSEERDARMLELWQRIAAGVTGAANRHAR